MGSGGHDEHELVPRADLDAGCAELAASDEIDTESYLLGHRAETEYSGSVTRHASQPRTPAELYQVDACVVKVLVLYLDGHLASGPGLGRSFAPCLGSTAGGVHEGQCTNGEELCCCLHGVQPAQQESQQRAATPVLPRSTFEIRSATPSKGAQFRGYLSKTTQRVAHHLADISARPPSMEWMPPVIQPASSEQRNPHNAAISSGWPTRPKGCVVFECSKKAS